MPLAFQTSQLPFVLANVCNFLFSLSDLWTHLPWFRTLPEILSRGFFLRTISRETPKFPGGPNTSAVAAGSYVRASSVPTTGFGLEASLPHHNLTPGAQWPVGWTNEWMDTRAAAIRGQSGVQSARFASARVTSGHLGAQLPHPTPQQPPTPAPSCAAGSWIT